MEEKGFVWLAPPGQSVIAEKSQWQGHKADAHITSIVRNRGKAKHAGLLAHLPSPPSSGPSLANGAACRGLGLPKSVNDQENHADKDNALRLSR